jgi:hypothetical protein
MARNASNSAWSGDGRLLIPAGKREHFAAPLPIDPAAV